MNEEIGLIVTIKKSQLKLVFQAATGPNLFDSPTSGSCAVGESFCYDILFHSPGGLEAAVI